MQLQESRFSCCDRLHEKLHSVTPPLLRAEFWCYVSQIFSQESQTIADYENMNLLRKAKAAKFKTLFLRDGFSTNLVYKTEFLNFGFCSFFFEFWHGVGFVKDCSVLVGRHTIFQCFLVKSDLCSLRPFSLCRSEKICRISKLNYWKLKMWYVDIF